MVVFFGGNKALGVETSVQRTISQHSTSKQQRIDIITPSKLMKGGGFGFNSRCFITSRNPPYGLDTWA